VPTLTWTATGDKTGSGAGNVGTALNPFPIGITTITYRATDASANFSTCSFTVKVTSDINLTGLSILASSVCQGSGTTALISGNLLDDSYTLGYSISGSNLGTYSTTLNVAGGTGGGSITIPLAQVPIAGPNTLTITSLTSLTTGCATSVAGVSSNFNVNTAPLAPTGSTSQSFCTYSGTSLNDVAITGTLIKWYDAPTGGNQYLGSTLVTNGTTYYASQSTGSCQSTGRLAVTISLIAPPAITSASGNSRCGTGTVSLSATASSGVVNWYNMASGGTLLGTGNTYTTPSISSTTSYWVAALGSGCETQTRTEVIATINAIPTITSVTNGSNCGAGTVTISAAASTGTVEWYTASSGGSSLGSGNNFTTPSIGTTTNYYASANNNGCISASRSLVVASIYPIPTIISVTDDSRCGNGIVTLDATASAGTINWYDAPTNGNLVHSGTSYSPILSSTTTFYVDATSNGCISNSRTPVTATITSIPSGNLVSNDGDNIICDGQSITFTANGGSSYNFLVNSVSKQNGVSPTYTTNLLANGDQISVVASNSGCNTTYSSITVTVLPSSVSPILIGPLNPGATSVNGTSTEANGSTVIVYKGGSSVGTTTTISGGSWSVNGISPALTNGDVITATVQATGKCISAVSGAVTITPLPQGSLTANGPFCSSGAGLLTWTATIGTGPYTVVYNDGTADRTISGVVSGTAFVPFTSTVSLSTTYTLVSVTDANTYVRNSGFTGGSATITVHQPPATSNITIN
jgi:hypothetical protein